jgi:uroporphyrin-III C-methyltransferase / precorrin-2 dehydrogenase / sirohydrochlorin ferrochelatase
MHSLPLFVRLRGHNVILIGEGDSADAKRRLLDRAGAVIVGEFSSAAFAIVATEEEGAAHAAVLRLKARGILVNAVDRPALCDFTLPAIIDRDPVLIAIGTGGASAGLAKAIRQRLEGLFPATLGVLANALFASRDSIKQRWPGAAERRRAIDAALNPGGLLDPVVGHTPDAVTTWLMSDAGPHINGLHVIAILSDDPDDLTLKQARLLGQADIVAYQPSVAPAILDRARADAARLACKSAPDPSPGQLILFLERH